MGSSFEDLVAASLSMKTDSRSDKCIGLQNILNFQILHLMCDDVSNFEIAVHACKHFGHAQGLCVDFRLLAGACYVVRSYIKEQAQNKSY